MGSYTLLDAHSPTDAVPNQSHCVANYWVVDAAEAFRALRATPEGLSTCEAAKRIRTFGRGVIRLVFQAVGKTTRELASLRPGESLADVLGPLGKAAIGECFGTVWCVVGGVGIAEVLPVAGALRRVGNPVVTLAGTRSIRFQILKDEIFEASDEVYWATEDGSAGLHGTAVDLLRALRGRSGQTPAFVHVIGPIPLMRAAAELTREWGIRRSRA